MIDRSRQGMRCRTVRQVRTPQGVLPRDCYGTFSYEADNMGRRIAFVNWDNGLKVPVFPNEIELLTSSSRKRAD